MRTLKFGIEIETVGLTIQQLAQAIHGAIGDPTLPPNLYGQVGAFDARGRLWRVVADASLSGGFHSGEIVSPILGYEDIEMLQKVVRAVRAAGARADSTTGIHIHIGASHFDAKSLTNLVKMVHKQERLLEHALGVSERRLGWHCRPIDAAFLQRLEESRPRTLAQVNEAWYGRARPRPARYDESRYRGLNLNSFFFRGTIEFRYFNGTLHAGEVKAYVQLTLALAAKALKARSASSKRRDFNVTTAKYDWRVFLLALGLIGGEFKTARHHLTKHLAGSAAWKGERRDRRSTAAAPSPTPGSEPAPSTTTDDMASPEAAVDATAPSGAGRNESHE
ncbi:MAG: amidoligase family protein [Kofleriaceae bacterium]